MNNLSLALFCCMVICILNYCPAVRGLMLEKGERNEKILTCFMLCVDPDTDKKRRKVSNAMWIQCP